MPYAQDLKRKARISNNLKRRVPTHAGNPSSTLSVSNDLRCKLQLLNTSRRDLHPSFLIFMNWGLDTITTLFTLLINFYLGILVFIKDKKSIVNRSLSYLLFVLVLWNISNFICYLLMDNLPYVLFGAYGAFISAIFIPSLFLLFVNFFIRGGSVNYKFIFVHLLPLLILLPFSIGRLSVREFYLDQSYWLTEPGFLYFPFTIYFLLYMGYGIYSLIKYFKSTDDQVKKFQAQLIIVGSMVSALIGIMFNSILRLALPSNELAFDVGTPVSIIFSISVSLAILKYRFLDIKLVIKKSLVNLFVLAVILGAVTYPLLLLEKFSNSIFALPQDVSTAVVAVIIGFSFPALQSLVKRTVNRFIDRDLDFGLVTDLMRGSIINSDQIRSMVFETSKEIEKHLNVDQISLLVRDHRFQTFVSEYPEQFKIRIPIDHDFVNFVSCVDRVFETPQLEKFASTKTGTGKNQIGKFVQILKKHHAEMVAPIIGEGGMVGIVFLPKKRNGAAFEKEEKQWLSLYLRSVEEKLTPILLAQDFQAFSKNPVESINFGGKVEYDG